MTDAATPSPDPKPTDAAPAAAKPKKKKRTWRQRFRLLILIVLVGACLFRIALNFLLPTVINRVAGIFDLECGYDRLNLSLLGGTANLYGLKLRPKGGGDSILQSDFIQGDISPLALLQGRLHVYRAEVDGVILAVDREADGSIPLINRFISATKTTAAAAKTPATTQPIKAMSLDAPLQVDAFRVSHVAVRLRDRSVTPAFEATVQTTLRVNQIGDPGDPTHIELDVGVDPVLDTLRVSGQAHTSPDELKADVKVLLRGLHPKQAAGYLAPLGLRPVADDVTVEANVALIAKTIPNTNDFSATLAVTDVKATTDGAQWASLKSMNIDAKRLGATGIDLTSVALADGDASARRTAQGNIEVAGIQLAPAAATAPPATQPLATAPAVTVTSAPPFHLSLGTLDLKNLGAQFTDEQVTPAAKLVARLDSLSLKGIDTAAGSAAAPVPLSLVASLPGVIRTAKVTGTFTPLADTKSLTLHVAADGIRPDALKAYLERFGIRCDLADAHFNADLHADVTPTVAGPINASASASAIDLTDGGKSLLQLNYAAIDVLTFTPADGSIAVKSIDIAGPALGVQLNPAGQPASSGFTFVGMPAAPQQTKLPAVAANASTAPPATQPVMAALPKIELGHFGWHGARLTVEDQASPTPATFVFDDAGVDLTDLLLDLGSANPQMKPGKFIAWLAAPGVAESLKASGTFAPGPNRLTTIVDVSGEGITAERLKPYLAPLGVVPTLSSGKLTAKASATVSQTDAGLGVNLEAHDVAWTDGPTELAGVDFFGLNGFSMTPKRIDIDALNVTHPRIRVARDNDGTLRAAGIHLVPVAAPIAPNVAAAAPTTVPSTQPDTGPAPLKLSPLPIELGIKALRVDAATLDWADAVPTTPAAIHAVASVAMDHVNVSPAGDPATLHVDAHVDGALDSATVDGTLILSPVAPVAKVAIKADGFRVGPLVSYFPPAIAGTLKDGHFATNVDIGVADHSDGGLTAHVKADGLNYTDGSATLAKVDAFTLSVNRVDPSAGVFSIGELSSRGVVASVAQAPEGIDVLGLRLLANPPAAAPATQPGPAASSAEPEAPSAPVQSVASMVADARKPLPHFTLDKLDLGVERLTLAGFTGADAAPVAVQNLTVTSPGAISFGGADAENAPPLVLNIAGGVSPLVDKFNVGFTVTPFAMEPAVDIDVKASGIQGDGVTKVLPSLKPRIDGSGLANGTFVTHVNASLNYGRRGPRDFDIGRGFTAMFDLKPLELHATPDSPITGVQSIHAENIKVEPKGGNLAIKQLEISTPVLRAYRDDRGIHAAGLTLLMGKDETTETLASPATGPATQPVQTGATKVAPPTNPVPANAAPAQQPANEIRLDRFTLSGADIVIEDRTAKPFTVVPIKSLDVDVQDLSNQLPWNGKSVRFSVLCTSDKVAMPPREGIKGAATTQPMAGEEYTEQRDLFSQVTASGKVNFVQKPDAFVLNGWTKTAVNGFEMLGVRGLAKQYGVTVGGGVFDDTNDIKFNPDGLIETKNKIVFTNLSMSEPANGPLQKLFKIPAPIDVAIGAVTDPDGSITLNLPVPIKNGAVSPGDVIGPAAGAVGGVLITGIASAPLKAAGGLAKLAGFGGGGPDLPDPPVVVKFLPAYSGLDAAADAQLATLAQQMKDDPVLEVQMKQTLTQADVDRAAVRANPTPQVAAQLAERLRKQRADLQARYTALAAQARGDFGAQADARAAAAAAALRTIGQQLAQADDSLDALYALTTPGAAAQADRRTKAASLDIARQRLDAIKSDLGQLGGPGAEKRVNMMNPQFESVPSSDGGDVTIVLVRKKH